MNTRKPKTIPTTIIRANPKPTDTKATVTFDQGTTDVLQALEEAMTSYYGAKLMRNLIVRRAVRFYGRYILQNFRIGVKGAQEPTAPNRKAMVKASNRMKVEREQLIKVSGKEPWEVDSLLRKLDMMKNKTVTEQG